MSKSPDAFRTISEVADWLEVQSHVLRFWESKFAQIKPIKRAGGRRYYRPADMQLLGGIKQLLHEDGMTIKGAQKIIREQGIGHVCTLSRPLDNNADASVEEPDAVSQAPDLPGRTILPYKSRSAEESAPSVFEPTPPAAASDAQDQLPMDFSPAQPSDPLDDVSRPDADANLPPASEPAALPGEPELPETGSEPTPPADTPSMAQTEEAAIAPEEDAPSPDTEPVPAQTSQRVSPSDMPDVEDSGDMSSPPLQDDTLGEADIAAESDAAAPPRPLIIEAPDPEDEESLSVADGILSIIAKTSQLPVDRRGEIAVLAKELRDWLDRTAGPRIS